MTDRVALVTGASRGVGRGIAQALGAAGWTVWVTGRSSAASGSTSHLPGTVEGTSSEVTAAGGRGLPVACDHRDDEQTRRLVDRIERESGHLDLLVNNAWGGYERLNAGAWDEWNAPFWEQPIDLFDAMFSAGVRAHYVTSALAAPILRNTGGSIIITVAMTLGARHEPGFGVAYSMAKAADERLVVALAASLRGDGIASIGLCPGLVRTEGVLQFAEHLDLVGSQSPKGVGRVVAGIAADTHVMQFTGQSVTVTELGRRYGIDVEA